MVATHTKTEMEEGYESRKQWKRRGKDRVTVKRKLETLSR